MTSLYRRLFCSSFHVKQQRNKTFTFYAMSIQKQNSINCLNQLNTAKLGIGCMFFPRLIKLKCFYQLISNTTVNLLQFKNIFHKFWLILRRLLSNLIYVYYSTFHSKRDLAFPVFGSPQFVHFLILGFMRNPISPKLENWDTYDIAQAHFPPRACALNQLANSTVKKFLWQLHSS